MRVILITGASSGIGAAAARALAAPDTAVALHARKNHGEPNRQRQKNGEQCCGDPALLHYSSQRREISAGKQYDAQSSAGKRRRDFEDSQPRAQLLEGVCVAKQRRRGPLNPVGNKERQRAREM